jgi:hypothetical protein
MGQVGMVRCAEQEPVTVGRLVPRVSLLLWPAPSLAWIGQARKRAVHRRHKQCMRIAACSAHQPRSQKKAQNRSAVAGNGPGIGQATEDAYQVSVIVMSLLFCAAACFPRRSHRMRAWIVLLAQQAVGTGVLDTYV